MNYSVGMFDCLHQTDRRATGRKILTWQISNNWLIITPKTHWNNFLVESITSFGTTSDGFCFCLHTFLLCSAPALFLSLTLRSADSSFFCAGDRSPLITSEKLLRGFSLQPSVTAAHWPRPPSLSHPLHCLCTLTTLQIFQWRICSFLSFLFIQMLWCGKKSCLFLPTLLPQWQILSGCHVVKKRRDTRAFVT